MYTSMTSLYPISYEQAWLLNATKPQRITNGQLPFDNFFTNHHHVSYSWYHTNT